MKTLILAAVLMAAVNASASVTIKRLETECFPKDKAHKHIKIAPSDDDSVNPSGITKAAFEEVINKVQAMFEPIVKQKEDAIFKINNLWDDSTVNAQAYQEWHQDPKTGKITKYFMVDAFGGLARYKGMSKNAFMLVMCHELGHHIGGQPKYNSHGWASVEGQSDYWGTIRCMKMLGASSYAASKALAGVLADLSGDNPPNEATPDTHIVTETDESHPAAQCRLDTFLAGRLCAASGDIGENDPVLNSCHAYPGGKAAPGDRPLCWYKP